ncbi:MAG: RNase adapter RapZ [Elusimicrobiota bacterium]|jgi:UPF0042 nucleotide-binding protein|nr:RNase adapter RapZ [Elusimicrobiota bacterium]
MENKKGKFFIITGISGAGKTQALKIFGDFGFYCVDNLPLALFKDFAKYVKTRGSLENIALGIDIREGESIKDLPRLIQDMANEGFTPRLLFLDAAEEVLVRRFSETKHKHPLAEQLLTALSRERAALRPIREAADEEINTSYLTLGELKEKISKLLEITSSEEMSISVISFGYKNGLPLEADLVMDVRFLKNPYYKPQFRDKTGLDSEVADFIRNSPDAEDFLKKFTDLVLYLIPKYIKEGKSYLSIAVGCSGGRHRSVFIAHNLAANLRNKGFKAGEFHRDVKIEKKEVW